jgi:hypothetical protein
VSWLSRLMCVEAMGTSFWMFLFALAHSSGSPAMAHAVFTLRRTIPCLHFCTRFLLSWLMRVPMFEYHPSGRHCSLSFASGVAPFLCFDHFFFPGFPRMPCACENAAALPELIAPSSSSCCLLAVDQDLLDAGYELRGGGLDEGAG